MSFSNFDIKRTVMDMLEEKQVEKGFRRTRVELKFVSAGLKARGLALTLWSAVTARAG